MNPPDSEPQLSIIIPAYNEEVRLTRALAKVRDYLAQQRLGPEQVEILVVDDGSKDATVRVAEEMKRDLPSLRVVLNGRNRGKGYSVRHGMVEARGRLALFSDADFSSPIEEWPKLREAIENGYDGAIGSRALDRSLITVHQAPLRELAGIIFNLFVRFFTGLTFQDTQCGFKAFVRERTRIIFEQQKIERFGFDPEILFLAKRHGLRIAEVPVRWAHDPATKVHVIRDSAKMFADLIYIRWNCIRGCYPRRKS
ncbi:MAG TPA: dolichyl-phosphate beta-glucosyltransferase [Verrucomicrobiae bacterium]|nr:dolichyl-phosphate beta-glucosyltransferase [Verrucomicrobiae bacterium]